MATEAKGDPQGVLHKSTSFVTQHCPFCDRIALQHDLLANNGICAAFYDTTPINPGHTLIVPNRHESDFFALSPEERNAILRMATGLHAQIVSRFRPDGFNVGVNIGEAGGQTIDHAHLHLIPRYHADVLDPKGGVRWLIPERARYWDHRDREGQ